MVVTATNVDDSTEIVTSEVVWSYNPATPNDTNITSVLVSATFNGHTDSELITGIIVSEKTSTLVISEAYGAGGNTGAIYKHDFVELYNNSDDTINLENWSLFYASSTGSFSRNNNMFTDLTGQILPKSHLLIRQNPGADTNSIEHPVLPDIIGTISMGANNFKLALTNSLEIPVNQFSANVIDFLGAGSATIYESSAAPAPQLGESISRTFVDGVYVDTDDNGSDFSLSSGINPMNMATSVASRIMSYEGGDVITPECEIKYSTIKSQVLLLSTGSLTYFQESNESNILNARERYLAWSVANGDTTPYESTMGRNPIDISHHNSLLAVVSIGVIGLSSILGYYFINKKKSLG